MVMGTFFTGGDDCPSNVLSRTSMSSGGPESSSVSSIMRSVGYCPSIKNEDCLPIESCEKAFTRRSTSGGPFLHHFFLPLSRIIFNVPAEFICYLWHFHFTFAITLLAYQYIFTDHVDDLRFNSVTPICRLVSQFHADSEITG